MNLWHQMRILLLLKNIRSCCYELLSLNVGICNTRPVIKSVLEHFGTYDVTTEDKTYHLCLFTLDTFLKIWTLFLKKLYEIKNTMSDKHAAEKLCHAAEKLLSDYRESILPDAVSGWV